MKAWLTDEHGLGEDLAGWRLTDAAGISDDGLTIAGNGVNPQGNDEGWVVKLAPFSLPGDYNNNGIVEQADLDLVLLHWGADAADVPDDWSGDLPIGIVDQDELDGVLLSWGGGATRTVGAVPEPQSLLLTLVILGAVWIGKKVRLDRQWG
jgi:hypothetical protein